ncbi:hypothetical protein VspSw1_103 [Vibrio phage VspSw_1]|uniref:Uncharacterized protein n=1 Tax=Vibrio phage VspSw_1 TaxID=2484249 RepID=A0A411BKU3_9CAUD|nr:hypothetical protein HOV08_gp103 [Vibrio phage VspSw_1]QAY02172.1 hypothetical protein VspSw1_103 [Vibrio phage VspSw_1]
MTYPILFLDFDGVINSDEGEIEWLKGDFFGFFQPHLVDRVNKITQAVPNCKLVISSTWRLGTDIDELADICLRLGLTAEVIGKTCSFGKYSVRGNEIYAYLKDNAEELGHDYRAYVILDDDCDMLYPQRHNFVRVNGMKGIQESDVDKAIAIFLENL